MIGACQGWMQASSTSRKRGKLQVPGSRLFQRNSGHPRMGGTGRGRDAARPAPPPHRSVGELQLIRLLPRMHGGQTHIVLLAAPDPASGTRLPASVDGPCGAWTAFSLARALPSGLSAGGSPPLFESFLGTAPRSDSSATYTWGVRLAPSPTGLPLRGRRLRGLPVLVRGVS